MGSFNSFMTIEISPWQVLCRPISFLELTLKWSKIIKPINAFFVTITMVIWIFDTYDVNLEIENVFTKVLSSNIFLYAFFILYGYALDIKTSPKLSGFFWLLQASRGQKDIEVELWVEFCLFISFFNIWAILQYSI